MGWMSVLFSSAARPANLSLFDAQHTADSSTSINSSGQLSATPHRCTPRPGVTLRCAASLTHSHSLTPVIPLPAVLCWVPPEPHVAFAFGAAAGAGSLADHMHCWVAVSSSSSGSEWSSTVAVLLRQRGGERHSFVAVHVMAGCGVWRGSGLLQRGLQ